VSGTFFSKSPLARRKKSEEKTFHGAFFIYHTENTKIAPELALIITKDP
jgi:hypothetical protein